MFPLQDKTLIFPAPRHAKLPVLTGGVCANKLFVDTTIPKMSVTCERVRESARECERVHSFKLHNCFSKSSTPIAKLERPKF